MNMKLINSSLAIVIIGALSSGLANANPPADLAAAPAPATTTAADQTGPLTLSDSQMDGVVAGMSMWDFFYKGYTSVGYYVGTAAGAVYCSTQGPNCGGATTTK